MNTMKITSMGIQKKIQFNSKSDRLENILEIIRHAYDYPIEYKGALSLRTAEGDIFDDLTFDNYILYHPDPQILFLMRIDFNKVRDYHAEEVSKDQQNKKNVFAFVQRQNCFLGSWPTDLGSVMQDFVNYSSPPPQKRRRLLIHSKKNAKLISTKQIRF